VAVNDSHAYIAGYPTLRVVLITDPANPTEVGSCGTYEANTVTVVGDYAYLSASVWGLVVMSAADPANPYEVGHLFTPSRTWDVDISGNYAYVIDLDSGLRVISISDPTNPTEVSACMIPRFSYGVAVNGECAFISRDAGTVYAVSVSDPANPIIVGHYDLTEPAMRLASVGDYIYVANGRAGLQILQFYGAGVEDEHIPSAICRKPAATVVRSLPQGAVAFDAMGRRVLNPRSGIVFLREPSAASGQPAAARKVIITQ
jgi:hypothetical protein